MAESVERRATLARLRWRLRGAWQWPVLWATALAGAAVLHWLPFSGDEGSPLFAGFLLCGFANLAIVALLGPVLGLVLRRRRPDLPRTVAADRVATTLMAGLFAVLLVTGLTHRPAIAEADRDARTQLAAARRWFAHNAPTRFRAGIGSENVYKAGPDLFRTCIPGPDPQKNLCVYVDTSGPLPTVREDPDELPNSVLAGPDNPGRR